MRAFLDYQGGSVELPEGITVVGRDVTCPIRFNDSFMSRRHVCFVLEVSGLWVEDAGSRNGTLLNGAPLERRQRVRHGDKVQVGRRTLRVNLLETAIGSGIDQETTRPDYPELASSDGGLAVALGGVEGLTGPTVAPPPITRTCLRCRADVPLNAETCPSCGARPRARAPLGATQEFSTHAIAAEVGALDRRREDRRRLQMPLVYTSETMTLDAVTIDLSVGGVYLASELLDAVETPCQVTLLPDGGAAMSIDGVVAHVVSQTAEGQTRPPGMGIRFVNLTDRVQLWLHRRLGGAG